MVVKLRIYIYPNYENLYELYIRMGIQQVVYRWDI